MRRKPQPPAVSSDIRVQTAAERPEGGELRSRRDNQTPAWFVPYGVLMAQKNGGGEGSGGARQ